MIFFRINAIPNGNLNANVIWYPEKQAPTKHLIMSVGDENGEIRQDIKRDLVKVAVIERHHQTGNINVGLVHGFGFNVPCAVATTFAHDCHQMIVVGTDDDEMILQPITWQVLVAAR